jgi:hypothetical protein
MAEEQDEARKTKAHGYITKDTAVTITGWADYEEAVRTLNEARYNSEKAKDEIRARIKDVLKLTGDVDFSVEKDGRVRVYEHLQKKRRSVRGTDLSGHFASPEGLSGQEEPLSDAPKPTTMEARLADLAAHLKVPEQPEPEPKHTKLSALAAKVQGLKSTPPH